MRVRPANPHRLPVNYRVRNGRPTPGCAHGGLRPACGLDQIGPTGACHRCPPLAILLTALHGLNLIHLRVFAVAVTAPHSPSCSAKVCISSVPQCYHFEFVLDGMESFPFPAGQFVSAVATDPNGKSRLAPTPLPRPPSGNRFDLCVNRVENGFFSNHLADLPDLPVGATIQIHGPHGHFILQEPITDSILVATGTGMAPMRGFTQWLFPARSRPQQRQRHLAGLRHALRNRHLLSAKNSRRSPCASPTSITCPRSAARRKLARPARSRAGAHFKHRGRARRAPRPAAAAAAGRSCNPTQGTGFDVYTYICGLNFMVSGVRELLDRLRLA